MNPFKLLALVAVAIAALFLLPNSVDSTSSRVSKPAQVEQPVRQPIHGYDAPPRIVPRDGLVILR